MSKQADCSSSFFIYVITCTRCNLQYVCQAKTFRLRVNNHKSAIRNANFTSGNDCTKLYEYFTSSGHSIDNLSFTIVQNGLKPREMLAAERQWIWKLKTIFPASLNVNDGFSCQLKGKRFSHK